IYSRSCRHREIVQAFLEHCDAPGIGGGPSLLKLRPSNPASYSSLLMSTLVECVPNFSEGRDKAKVDAIVDAMKVDGVFLLDREMDADHNRCVITLVGDRDAIQEAAIRG